MIIAGPGLVERIRQLLLPLLASYECDEPHWDEKGTSYIPPISYERLMADLALEHRGDCTQEAQPCLRCHAEGWNHKATWLAERVAAFAAEVAQDRLDELNMVQGQLGLAQIALTKSEAREARLREALDDKETIARLISGADPDKWPSTVNENDAWSQSYRRVADRLIAHLSAALAEPKG